MTDWSHGYNVSLGYTYGYYRELAPDWLDFCARISGFAAPGRGPEGQFRYLELGSGQGFGLCLLAAANPQAEFVGVDFNPEHIAHATAIAESGRLTNIRFVEGDFSVLGADWPADFGQFDYVALHGIYSWVPAQVRGELVTCLDHAVVPGGLVYNSYNTKPGWLATMPFQHLARRTQIATNKAGPDAMEAAVTLFDKLADINAAMFSALPGLKGRVDSVRKQNRNYLVQEYLHEEWHPFWFSEVAGELAQAKLTYMAPATVAELLLPGLLPEPQRNLINEQAGATLRQEVLDCIINQSFRRDIFCRGPRKTFQHPFQASMTTVLYLQAKPESYPLKIASTFGELNLREEIASVIVEALEAGPRMLEELLTLPEIAKIGASSGIQAIILMLQAGLLGVGRQPSGSAAAQAFNARVVRQVCEGAPYGFLAAANLGGAIGASDIDCMMLDTYLQNGAAGTPETFGDGLQSRLKRLNRSLSHAGKRLEGQKLEERVAQLAVDFANTGLGKLRRLGAIE